MYYARFKGLFNRGLGQFTKLNIYKFARIFTIKALNFSFVLFVVSITSACEEFLTVVGACSI